MKCRWLAGDRLVPSPNALTIFNPDPNHILNRTAACLFLRQSGDGEPYDKNPLDPRDGHPLSGDSYRRALACLDEFLNSHAEQALEDPVKQWMKPRFDGGGQTSRDAMDDPLGWDSYATREEQQANFK